MSFNDQGVSPEDELVRTVKGYGGYVKTDTRKDTDQRIREHLAAEIGKIEKSFTKISRRVANQGKAKLADTIGKLVEQLTNLIQSLNQPAYNNSSFFMYPKIDSELLSRLYLYESQLKYHVDILMEEVSQLESIEEDSEANDFLNHFFDVIDNINQIMIEREFLLNGGDIAVF